MEHIACVSWGACRLAAIRAVFSAFLTSLPRKTLMSTFNWWPLACSFWGEHHLRLFWFLVFNSAWPCCSFFVWNPFKVAFYFLYFSFLSACACGYDLRWFFYTGWDKSLYLGGMHFSNRSFFPISFFINQQRTNIPLFGKGDFSSREFIWYCHCI